MDDFAWRKGTKYGTLICDLQTGVPIDLLPDRSKESLTGWLKNQEKVYIVSRDGSMTYRNAIQDAGKSIIQVSDRFHLIANLHKHMISSLKRVLPQRWSIPKENDIQNMNDSAKTFSPQSNSSQAALQDEPFVLSSSESRKWAFIQELKREFEKGQSMRSLARKYKMSRATIKKYLQSESPILHTRRKKQNTILSPYFSMIIKQLQRNATIKQIYSLIKEQGYQGSYSTVRAHIALVKKKISMSKIENPPQEQQIFRQQILPLYWKTHRDLAENEKKYLNQTLSKFPETKELYGFVQMFREQMAHLDSKGIKKLLFSFQNSAISEIKSFVSFLIKDIDAVMASLNYTYNNGVIEGQINRLKYLKRMMYGRASFELLRKRVLFRM